MSKSVATPAKSTKAAKATAPSKVTAADRASITRVASVITRKGFDEAMVGIGGLSQRGFTGQAITGLLREAAVRIAQPNWSSDEVAVEVGNGRSHICKGLSSQNVGFYVTGARFLTKLGVYTPETFRKVTLADAHAAYVMASRGKQYGLTVESVALALKEGKKGFAEIVRDAIKPERAKVGAKRKSAVETLIAALIKGGKVEMSQAEAKRVSAAILTLGRRVQKIAETPAKGSARKSHTTVEHVPAKARMPRPDRILVGAPTR